MTKIYAAITIIAIFVAGWFAGKRSSDNYWHKQSETQLQQYNQQLTEKLQTNEKLAESYGQLDIQYQITLKDKQNAIEKNRKLINANNRITKQLVRYIQKGESGNVVQGSNTESATDANATIPASDFGIWASGLITHDQQCVNQLDTLIKAVINVN